MSRHFPSIEQFMLCNKASVTVRIIDVKPQMENFFKKNSKTGMVESVPFYRGLPRHSKCVLAKNFGITLASTTPGVL